MPYCENCGTQISATAKFCGNCGAQRNPTQTTTEPVKPAQPTPKAAQPKSRIEYYSPPNMAWIPQAPHPIIGQQSAPQTQFTQPPPVMQPAATIQPTPVAASPQSIPTAQTQTGEATFGVILFRHNKSLGRYDSYAGVLTTQRLIFAQLTADMINQAAQQARDQAKAQGKSFLGAWGDQLKATFGYIKKYQNIPPDAIIAETPGNFAIYNSAITEVKVHLKGQHENDGPREFEAEIKSTSGTFKYRMNEDRDNTDLLKRVYGERVKMPFGYLGAVNIKF
jgi:hypothetical protein